MSFVCEICGENTGINEAIHISHISSRHDISKEEYYFKYIRVDIEECKYFSCKNPGYIRSLTEGYHAFCSWECECKYNTLNKVKSKKPFHHYPSVQSFITLQDWSDYCGFK